MKYKLDVSIMVDEWPMMSCTLMRSPYCERVSELDHNDYILYRDISTHLIFILCEIYIVQVAANIPTIAS